MIAMKRRQLSLHYCSICKATTKHSESETTSVCLRCGATKTLTRVTKSNANPQRNDEPGWN